MQCINVGSVATEAFSVVRCVVHFRHVTIGVSVLRGSGSARVDTKALTQHRNLANTVAAVGFVHGAADVGTAKLTACACACAWGVGVKRTHLICNGKEGPSGLEEKQVKPGRQTVLSVFQKHV